MAISLAQDGRTKAAETRSRPMAKKAMTIGMTRTDRAFAWTMMAGLAFALVQYAQAMALPAHFV